MRTKALLLSAALVAAGVASSMAQQNVYSLNVVGYVNVTLTNGFNMIANPLDAGALNTITNLFGTNVPVGTTVSLFDPTNGTFDTSATLAKSLKWTIDAPFIPGQGAFVFVPLTATTPITVTFVGQIASGSYTNTQLATYGGSSGSFSCVGSVIPVSGAFDGSGTNAINWVPTIGDTVNVYDPTITNFDTFTFAKGNKWAPSDPIISPGEGFFLFTKSSSWVQTFSVQ